jgi:hypothetical protein
MQGGNKNAYWLKIDAEIVRITNTSPQELRKYISNADKLIRECILANLAILEKNKSDIIADINSSVNSETDINKLKREIIAYRTAAETGTLTDLITRINNFRL